MAFSRNLDVNHAVGVRGLKSFVRLTWWASAQCRWFL